MPIFESILPVCAPWLIVLSPPAGLTSSFKNTGYTTTGHSSRTPQLSFIMVVLNPDDTDVFGCILANLVPAPCRHDKISNFILWRAWL